MDACISNIVRDYVEKCFTSILSDDDVFSIDHENVKIYYKLKWWWWSSVKKKKDCRHPRALTCGIFFLKYIKFPDLISTGLRTVFKPSEIDFNSPNYSPETILQKISPFSKVNDILSSERNARLEKLSSSLTSSSRVLNYIDTCERELQVKKKKKKKTPCQCGWRFLFFYKLTLVCVKKLFF